MRRLLARVVALFRRRHLDDELAEEIAAHLEFATADNLARGMSLEDARLTAARKFGGVEQVKEIYRDHRGLPVMENMIHDLRYAVRSVVRRRGLALAIVLTLALGIGANGAIFSAIDAILLRPLPYPAADRLVAVNELTPKQTTSMVAAVRIEEWTRMSHTFDGFVGSYLENMTDTTGILPERVVTARTSPNFFGILGTPAALGQTFTPDEEVFGGPSTVVVSDGFWRMRLNGDPEAVGRSLILGGATRTIIGVMPPSFRYPSIKTEAWVPAQSPARLLSARQARFYTVVGRIKSGATVDTAREDLAALQHRLGEQFPVTDKGWGARVAPLKEEQVGGARRSLWLLFAAVLLVLLAACGNIACLLLADATRREQEVAVRLALGAPRRAIVRQVLLEGLVLSLVGSIAGLLLARWGIDALRVAATSLPRVTELHVESRLIVFTLTVGVLTTLLFALAPALQSTRGDVAGHLAHGGRGQIGGRQWLQRVLVSVQVALAIVLLVGAGLLIRSFSRLQQVSPGFDPSDILTFRVSGSFSERPAAVANWQLRTMQRLRAIPGVTSVALAMFLPSVDGDFPPSEFAIAGREPGDHDLAVPRSVSADYFSTLRIPMLRGDTCRDDPREVAGPTKAIVSRTFVDRFFPGENPLGHQVTQRFSGEIVGVVADAREQSLMKDPQPVVYVCGLLTFYPESHYLVRSDPARAVSMTTIREAVHEIEPSRAVYSAATLTDALSDTLSQPRLNTILLTLFAVMALLLAAIGLFGLLAQFVSQRRREIGLRMALGARPIQVFAQVLRHGAAVTGAGIVLGVACALGLARFVASLVFGISARDPGTFAMVPLMLALIAAAAMIIPARRAVRVDPMQALRDD